MVAPLPSRGGQAATRPAWLAEGASSYASKSDAVVVERDDYMEHKYADDDEQASAESADLTSAPVSASRAAAAKSSKRPRAIPTRQHQTSRTAHSALSAATSKPAQAHSTAAWYALHSQLAMQAHKLEREAAISSHATAWQWDSGGDGKLIAEVLDSNRQLLQWSRTEQSLQHEREKEAAHLHKSVSRIKSALDPFLQRVAQQQRHAAKQHASGVDSEAQQAEAVRDLEAEMELIEELLTRFKREQKRLYLALDRDEREEEAACNIHLQRVQQWEAADAETTTAAPQKSHSRHGSKPLAALVSAVSAPPALQSLDADIAAAGGATGGWSTVDHDAFVACWHAAASAMQCVQRLLVALPHKTQRQCEEHVRWWQTYRRWMEERKFVIAQWKEGKQRDKERQRQRTEEAEEEKHELEEQQREEQADKAADERQQQARSIAQWKEQKVVEREQRGKEKEEQQRTKEQQKARQREVYHQQQKEALAIAHAAQQQAQLEAEASGRVEREQRRQDEKKARREEAKRRLQQQQAEVARKVEERRERQAAKQAADERRRRLLEESAAVVGVRAERHVGRLWARTEASEQRASEVKEELDDMQERRRQGKAGQMSLQPREAQSLITPSWRQGL